MFHELALRTSTHRTALIEQATNGTVATMGNVYRQDSQRLHELLDKASAPTGATLLIPDLQRPFVWTPNQVTLLLDSLIRGWPFGTLLLWKINHQELRGIPFRAFWTNVDRTVDESDGGRVPQMNPPAQYHMVLDGQRGFKVCCLP
jgi:Protein of unknown function DUF262